MTKNSQKIQASVEIIEGKMGLLSKALDKQIYGFKSKKDLNRKYAVSIKIAISVLGVFITVILGLQVNNFQSLFSNIALVLSGTITLLNSLESLFGNRFLWIQYTMTLNQLYALRSDLEYLLAKGVKNIEENEVDELYNRYSSILNETNKEWEGVRKSPQTSG